MSPGLFQELLVGLTGAILIRVGELVIWYGSIPGHVFHGPDDIGAFTAFQPDLVVYKRRAIPQTVGVLSRARSLGDGTGAIGAAPGYATTLVSLIAYSRCKALQVGCLRQRVLCRVVGQGFVDIGPFKLPGVEIAAGCQLLCNIVEDAPTTTIAATTPKQEISAADDDQQEYEAAATEQTQ
jgi:hypothetical protein